jgi:DNA-binding CsgD family transcriptional regulator
MHPMLLLGDVTPLATALAAAATPLEHADHSTWGAAVVRSACELVRGDGAQLCIRQGRVVREFTCGNTDAAATHGAPAVRLGVMSGRPGADLRLSLVCYLAGDETTLRNVRRWQAVLGLLRPALAAALRERFHSHPADGQLMRVLDALDAPMVAYTPDGHVLHENVAFRRLTANEPNASQLLREVTRAARDVATREFATRRASYRVTARRIAVAPGTEVDVVTVQTIDALDTSRTMHRFRSHFGLSPREAEVARMLIDGRPNTEIAITLGISESTARHHTQRVLEKLGVHSRAAIPSLLLPRADGDAEPART